MRKLWCWCWCWFVWFDWCRLNVMRCLDRHDVLQLLETVRLECMIVGWWLMLPVCRLLSLFPLVPFIFLIFWIHWVPTLNNSPLRDVTGTFLIPHLRDYWVCSTSCFSFSTSGHNLPCVVLLLLNIWAQPTMCRARLQLSATLHLRIVVQPSRFVSCELHGTSDSQLFLCRTCKVLFLCRTCEVLFLCRTCKVLFSCWTRCVVLLLDSRCGSPARLKVLVFGLSVWLRPHYGSLLDLGTLKLLSQFLFWGGKL